MSQPVQPAETVLAPASLMGQPRSLSEQPWGCTSPPKPWADPRAERLNAPLPTTDIPTHSSETQREPRGVTASVWKHPSIPRGDGAGDNTILASALSDLSISTAPGPIPPLTNTDTHPEPALPRSPAQLSRCTLCKAGIYHPLQLHFFCKAAAFPKQAGRGLCSGTASQPPWQAVQGTAPLGWQQPAHPGLCSHLPEPRQLLLSLASAHPSSSRCYCTYGVFPGASSGNIPSVRAHSSAAARASLPPSLPPCCGRFFRPLVRGTSRARSLECAPGR